MLGVEILPAPHGAAGALLGLFTILLIVAFLAFVWFAGTRRGRAVAVVGTLSLLAAVPAGFAHGAAQQRVEAAEAQTVANLQDHYDIELVESDVPLSTVGRTHIDGIDRLTKKSITVTLVNDGHQLILLDSAGTELTAARERQH